MRTFKKARLNKKGEVEYTRMGYLKEKKKKGSYVDRFFKENLKPIKETFYINNQKFKTIKLKKEK